jgi:muramoyltetrapeptide carboxypeptidase
MIPRRIGVAALSGPCDAERLAAGLEELRRLGCEPVLARNVESGREPCGLFAGSDDERLAAFHELLADRQIEAVVFARGGHGVLRLMPRLDWRLLRRRARSGMRFCGYSDLTPFLLELVRRSGCPMLHGPMVAADLARGLDSAEAESFLRGLGGAFEAEHRVTLHSRLTREVRGPLLGGCLSLLVATLGTRFAPRFSGSLILLEDVDEPVYRRDRMLTHLRLSGTLNGAQALIFGHFEPACEGLDSGWGEVIHEVSEQTSTAAATGLAVGHAAPNYTVALGAPARLTPGGSLLIEQPSDSTSRADP